MALADRIGQVFGQWTVIDTAPYLPTSPTSSRVWCRCSCGRERIVQVTNLTTGLTRRCDRCRLRAMAEAAERRLLPLIVCRCGAQKHPNAKSCMVCWHKRLAATPSRKFPWKLREVASFAGVCHQAVSKYVGVHGVEAAERFYGYPHPPR